MKIGESMRNKRMWLHSRGKPDIVNANGCIDCTNNGRMVVKEQEEPDPKCQGVRKRDQECSQRT